MQEPAAGNGPGNSSEGQGSLLTGLHKLFIATEQEGRKSICLPRTLLKTLSRQVMAEQEILFLGFYAFFFLSCFSLGLMGASGLVTTHRLSFI